VTNEDRTARLRGLTSRIVGTYAELGGINRIGARNLPSQRVVGDILEELLAVCFPGYHGEPVPSDADLEILVGSRLDALSRHLGQAMERTLRFAHHTGCVCESLWRDSDRAAAGDGAAPFAAAAMRLTAEYLDELPEIRRLLDLDVKAAYEGDPAATNREEIILSYPGFAAISVHRLAHPLYRLGVPLLPRMMSEWAHQRTGVDVHPGAAIGPSFFIDHGTGVVIGETTRIGAGVKIYQGVTLGALSFPRNADGTLVKGGRRHPTIGDGVTIYANATILGGETVIGDGAVIGGGAWLTASVPAGARVIPQPGDVMRNGRPTPDPEETPSC